MWDLISLEAEWREGKMGGLIGQERRRWRGGLRDRRVKGALA